MNPCGGTLYMSPGLANQQVQFTVYDLTEKSQSFPILVNCSGIATSCSASPTTANINPDSYTTITVTYNVSSTMGSGLIALTGNSDSGYINISTTHLAANVTLPYYNNDNVEATLCASNCFDKVLTYTSPAYYVMDTPEAVTLMYRSSTANPMVTVQVDAKDSSTVRPAMMSLKVHRPGGTWMTFTNGSTELFFQFNTSDNPARLAGQFAPQDGDTLTGAYNYTAVVTSYWSDGTVLSDSTPLRVLIENERSSVIGSGWTVAGQQTAYVQSDGSLVITDGMGGISYFQIDVVGCVYSCQFTSPTGDYSQITSVDSGSNAPHYTRTYPDGHYVQFHVNGNVFQIHDKNQNVTFYYYNSLWQDSVIIDPMGHKMSFVYDTFNDGWKAGSLRSLWDDFGRGTWFGVNSSNNMQNIQDPSGTLAQIYFYNAQHQVIQYVDRGNNVWNFSYDFAGKLLADTTPVVTANGTNQGLTTNYQSAERTMLINPSSGLGSSTNPASPEGGGPWWASVTDPNGNTTSVTLDRWGQPLQINDPGGGVTTIQRSGPFPYITTAVTGAVDTTVFTNGLLTYVHQAGSTGTTLQYHNNWAIPDSVFGQGQASVHLTLDGNGDILTQRIAGLYTTTYYPNGQGRDTMMVDPADHATHYHYDPTTGNLDSTLSIGNSYTKRTFDTYGRMSQAWANTTPKAQMIYDVLNRVDKVSSGVSGDTTRYFYDDSLHLTRIEDAKGQTYRDTVNALGWATRSYDPDASKGYLSYAYDKNGNVLSYINRRGDTVSFTYDPLNRVTSKSGTGVVGATYTYTANRRVATGSNAIASTTRYYDATGWLDSVVTSFPSASQTFNVTYTPTSVLQLASIGISGRPTQPTFATRRFVWDPSSSFLDSAYMNSNAIAYEYDLDGMLTNASFTGGVSLFQAPTAWHMIDSTQWSIPYTGRPPTPTPRIDSLFSRAYAYDSLGRVTQQRFMTWPDYPATPYFTSAQAGYAPRGTVDDFKIITSVTCAQIDSIHGVGCSSTGSSVTTDTSYGTDLVNNDTLISVNGTGSIASTYATGNRILTHGGSTFTTDLDGNIIRRLDASGRDERFGWSPDGLLVTDTTEGNGHVMTYDYDAFGQLARRTSDGTVQNYLLWNGTQLLTELNGTATAVVQEFEHHPGLGMPIATVNAGGPYFMAYDQLGNLIGVFADTLAFATYTAGAGVSDPYGNNIEGPPASALAWKGLLWEGDSTQLYYAQNRWFDPVQGRWLSQDPVGLAGGINLYAFAGGDGINGNDPLGLRDDPDDDGCGGDPECGEGGGGIADGGDGPPTEPTIQVTAPYNWDYALGLYGDIGSSIPDMGPTIADQYFGEQPATGTGFQGDQVITSPQAQHQTLSPCVSAALASGALHVGVDAIGLMPEGAGVSRALGNALGYRGIVATQQGAKAVKAIQGAGLVTGMLSTTGGLGETSVSGLASSALGIGGVAVAFIEGATPIGQAIAAATIAIDLYSTYKKIQECNR